MGIRIHLVGSKNEVYNAPGHGYLFHVRIANRTYPGLLPRLTGRQRFCSEMTHLTLAELKIDGARVALCGNGQPLPPGRWVFCGGREDTRFSPSHSACITNLPMNTDGMVRKSSLCRNSTEIPGKECTTSRRHSLSPLTALSIPLPAKLPNFIVGGSQPPQKLSLRPGCHGQAITKH